MNGIERTSVNADIHLSAERPSYIVTEVHILEGDLCNTFVCAVYSLIKCICLIVYAENASAARNELTVLKRGSCLEYDLAADIDTCDLVTLRIALRISA